MSSSLRLRIGALFLLVAGGCIGETSQEPPIVPIRNMYNQERYLVQGGSRFFADGRAMRPLVEGTVSREMESDLGISNGRSDDDSAWLAEIPPLVVQRNGGMAIFVERGQQRYGIYCAPCHGAAGDGRGTVARRAQSIGATAMTPPTFHDDRLRHLPDGQVFATISNGIRNMPAYRHNIPTDDRWAIVTYVRALQLSQASARPQENQP